MAPLAVRTLRRLRHHAGELFLFAAALVLMTIAVRRILSKVGHPAAPLDDAYIHFQYARAIAEGHPFRFQAGEPTTSGATSVLWPLLLAPFYLAGFKGHAMVWGAWFWSWIAWSLLARETWLLGRPLFGRGAAAGAAIAVLAFGGYGWFAASGMEVVPFAFLLVRTVRVASEFTEGRREKGGSLVGLCLATSLMRPEGGALALASGICALTNARGPRRRVEALLATLASGAMPFVLWLFTGSPKSTTMTAKLLVTNPYYPWPTLLDTVKRNVELLTGTLLNGEVWAAEFLPAHGAWLILLSVPATLWLAITRKRMVRGALILSGALLIAAPCFYSTFLWNRLRYLWPFAAFVILAVAGFAAFLGHAVTPFFRKGVLLGPGLMAVFAGLLFGKLDWILDDVAQSASGIARQQVLLGNWVQDNLPPDSRVGVNDTGAIAYFGNRPTFDVVGLTTRDEARYWVSGAASRFEHYERLARETLPTHFVVYPEWFALDPLLGAKLHEATVTDSTILGGQTMRAHRADYTLLGTGAGPRSFEGEILDDVDVADLESEREHHYELLGAREGEQTVRVGTDALGKLYADGGRTERTQERFRVRGSGTVLVVLRASSRDGANVTMEAGQTLCTRTLAEDTLEEVACPLELSASSFTVRADRPISTFHYWFLSHGTKKTGGPE